MRSVHETDTLRPSDSKANAANLSSAVGTPVSKLQRIRLKLSQPKEPGAEAEPPNESILSATLGAEPSDADDTTMPEFGPELGFDDHELAMPPRELYRLLRRQIHWAEKETDQLRAEWEELRPKHEQAWTEKEYIFDDVIEAELRLFNALLGRAPDSSLTGSNTNLEKLYHQQQQFKQQQEQLQAESEEPAEVNAAA